MVGINCAPWLNFSGMSKYGNFPTQNAELIGIERHVSIILFEHMPGALLSNLVPRALIAVRTCESVKGSNLHLQQGNPWTRNWGIDGACCEPPS
jgi:hypothetical protein